MVNYHTQGLSAVFSALGDPTRRAIVAQLARGACSVSELAAPFRMSLPGLMKHLSVLEQSGLLARSKQGRVVKCSLEPQPMREAAEWLARYQAFWEQRLDALDRYLTQEEPAWPHSRPNRHSPSSAPSKQRPRKSGGRSRKTRR